MKILYIVNVDFALRQFLLPLMRGARARGHEAVAVCADGPMIGVVRDAGFRVITVPLVRRIAPLTLWRAYRDILGICRAERPDLVHAHMPISGFIGRLAARRAGARRIAYTCHGFLFNQPGSWLRRGAALAMELIAGRVTDDFLTVSAQGAADAARLRIARHPRAVGNGRDPAQFRPDPAARLRIRREFGVEEDRPVVIAVSRLVRHKGYQELLAAMVEVDAELWVVGSRLPSDHGAALDRLFADHRLGPRLRMLGYREDVAELLAAADIFTLPSHFEGLPMSIIEAMLTGLPVVASDISGPREQVIPDETGLLVPPAQAAPLARALQRLAVDPALRARMGAAGLARARALFDERLVVGRTLDALGL